MFYTSLPLLFLISKDGKKTTPTRPVPTIPSPVFPIHALTTLLVQQSNSRRETPFNTFIEKRGPCRKGFTHLFHTLVSQSGS